MCLFHFSTRFEQPNAHHQENQLYQYIIWYISLCVGGCLVCRSSLTSIPDGHQHRVTYTRCCVDKIDSPDDEHWVVQNMYRSETYTLKKCVKLVLNMKCTEILGQHYIKCWFFLNCKFYTASNVIRIYSLVENWQEFRGKYLWCMSY